MFHQLSCSPLFQDYMIVSDSSSPDQPICQVLLYLVPLKNAFVGLKFPVSPLYFAGFSFACLGGEERLGGLMGLWGGAFSVRGINTSFK